MIGEEEVIIEEDIIREGLILPLHLLLNHLSNPHPVALEPILHHLPPNKALVVKVMGKRKNEFEYVYK